MNLYEKKLTNGVLQGCAGAASTFSLIHDTIHLPNTIESFTKLIADDTKIYAKINTNTHNTLFRPRQTECLLSNMLKWKLKFNTSQCKVMHIGNKK